MTAALRFGAGLLHGTRSFGLHVAAAVNVVLLTVIYLLAVMPTALVARLCRKHLLPLQQPAADGSLWITLDLSGREPESYLRQY